MCGFMQHTVVICIPTKSTCLLLCIIRVFFLCSLFYHHLDTATLFYSKICTSNIVKVEYDKISWLFRKYLPFYGLRCSTQILVTQIDFSYSFLIETELHFAICYILFIVRWSSVYQRMKFTFRIRLRMILHNSINDQHILIDMQVFFIQWLYLCVVYDLCFFSVCLWPMLLICLQSTQYAWQIDKSSIHMWLNECTVLTERYLFYIHWNVEYCWLTAISPSHFLEHFLNISVRTEHWSFSWADQQLSWLRNDGIVKFESDWLWFFPKPQHGSLSLSPSFWRRDRFEYYEFMRCGFSSFTIAFNSVVENIVV